MCWKSLCITGWTTPRNKVKFQGFKVGNDPQRGDGGTPNHLCRVLEGEFSRGGGNWGTLRIPEGKIGEP